MGSATWIHRDPDIAQGMTSGIIQIKDKMTISPEFAAALILATSNIEGAIKDSTNPHFRSKYADLSSVIAAIKKPLNDQGIAFLQRTLDSSSATDYAIVETILLYKTGETYSLGIVSIKPEKAGPQGYMAALTYARRAGLSSLGIPSYDDDGNEASGIKAEHQAEAPKKIAEAPNKATYYYIPEITDEQAHKLEELRVTFLGYGYYKSPRDLGPKLKDKIVTFVECEKRLARLKEQEKEMGIEND